MVGVAVLLVANPSSVMAGPDSTAFGLWNGGIARANHSVEAKVLARPAPEPRLVWATASAKTEPSPVLVSSDLGALTQAFARIDRKVAGNRSIPGWARDNMTVMLKARLLAGLDPDIRWSSSMVEKADAAVRICSAIGGISHTPPRPAGMGASDYVRCSQAARESCLAYGRPGEAVRMYLEDFGSHNAREVGHRRTLLRPDMAATGLSCQGIISALSVDLESVSNLPAAIAWPTAGQFPRELLSRSMPWSLDLIGRGLTPATRPTVRVARLDSSGSLNGKSLSVSLNAATSDLVVFAPQGVETTVGSRYLVEIKGLRALRKPNLPAGMWMDTDGTLRYIVEVSGLEV